MQSLGVKSNEEEGWVGGLGMCRREMCRIDWVGAQVAEMVPRMEAQGRKAEKLQKEAEDKDSSLSGLGKSFWNTLHPGPILWPKTSPGQPKNMSLRSGVPETQEANRSSIKMWLLV